MDQCDHDLQDTDGSGSLGGPDVRRRIPIKPISKQLIRSKPGSFSCKQEERLECKSGDAYASHRRFPQQMFWDYKMNLIGEKDESPIHFCDRCGLPIKIYGRMIPCKHVFCYECAMLQEEKADNLCPGCTDAVQRIEQCLRGSLFMCSAEHGCKRTYLSKRDLQAHVSHRHLRGPEPATGRPAPPSSSSSSSNRSDRFLLPPPPHLPKPHVPYGQPPPPPHDDLRSTQAPPPTSSTSTDHGPPRSLPQETYRIATVTMRKRSNLITVPIQDDSASSAPSSREPLPQPGPAQAPPPRHHPPVGDYSAGPVVTHAHHLMAQQQHYPPAPIIHPIQHSSQGSGTAHMVYNQAPPLASAPPPITPPPGHIINQTPPYMNHLPPGPLPVGTPPPHRYNPASLPQFSEDQGTLSPSFNKPGGLGPGIWPTPRGPPPPQIQGPPPQTQLPGPHHPDPSRFRPYYQ